MKKLAIAILSVIIVAIFWLIAWDLEFDPKQIVVFYWFVTVSLFVCFVINWCLNEIFD